MGALDFVFDVQFCAMSFSEMLLYIKASISIRMYIYFGVGKSVSQPKHFMLILVNWVGYVNVK